MDKSRARRASILRVPRYVRNLNALAESCGLVVRTYGTVKDGTEFLCADWVGSMAQLLSTGLIARGHRFPQTVGMLTIPRGEHWSRHPLLKGIVKLNGDNVLYEIDCGPMPNDLTMKGDIEIASGNSGSIYHGSPAGLLATGICAIHQLATGKRTLKREANRL